MEMKHRKFRVAVTSGDGMRGGMELCIDNILFI